MGVGVWLKNGCFGVVGGPCLGLFGLGVLCSTMFSGDLWRW